MADPDTNDDLIGPPDTAMLSQRPAADVQTQRFAKQRQHSILNAAVDIASDEDYEALAPGTRFMGPDRKQRVKPYEVKSDEDFDLVPEGAQFVDPEGKMRQKPKAEGIGYSAETLYQMARTPETRRQALKKFYGDDKVKQDTRGEFYVEDEGKILRPGHGVSGFAGGMTAEAAPAAGMLAGGLLGGAGGEAVEPIGGFIPGGTGGAMLGAAAGRQLNNVVLGLAGIHESLPEQIKSVAGEVAGVGAGELVGRGLTKIPAAAMSAKTKVRNVGEAAGSLRENLPKVLEQLGVTPAKTRKFLGTTEATAQRASDIVEDLPPSKAKVADFDPAFEPHGGAEPYEAAQFLENLSPTKDRPQALPGWRAIFLPGQTEPTYVRVPPSVYAPEAPMLKKIEEFERVFRSQNIVHQSWEALYNKQVPRILADANIGVSIEELATQATKKVSSERAGQLVLGTMQKEMAEADAVLENARRDAIKAARTTVDQLGGEVKAAQFQKDVHARLTEAYDRAQEAAGRYIQATGQDLSNDIALSIRMAAGGEDTGDLNKAIAAKFHAYNTALRIRAREMYSAANDAAGGARLDIGGLSEEADAFLKGVPEQVRQKYPVEIANLSKIAQALAREGQNEAVDTTLSFGELHQLRSWFRYGIDYQDMTPDMRAGSLKFFEKKINDLLHSAKGDTSEGRWEDIPGGAGSKRFVKTEGRWEDIPGAAGSRRYIEAEGRWEDIPGGAGSRRHVEGELPPSQSENLKTAADLLDKADAFYKEHIPFLSDKMVKGTIKMLESGEGANPEALAKLFFNPDRISSMRRVRGIVGENLWKGVQAADVRHMLDQARIIGSDDIDGAKFAQQIEQRLKDGILETAYDAKTAAKLQKIATDVRTLKGELPIKADPGDTVSTLMRKAQLAKEEADKFAEMDPLKALAEAQKTADNQYNTAMKAAHQARQQEPLGFAYQSHLAVKAADKILGSQDLIQAAASKFGRDSPEFNALRQVYAQRFLQREFTKTAAMRAELGGERGMTEEVQALMFPGITRDQMVTLAKNMEFLFSAGGTDVGGALAAANRVLHPEANFPIMTKGLKFLMQLPLASTAARYTLGQFYALAMDATTHPNFIHWLAGRLEGDVFARAEARAAIQQRIRMGALLGRVAGQQMLTPQQGNQQSETMQ